MDVAGTYCIVLCLRSPSMNQNSTLGIPKIGFLTNISAEEIRHAFHEIYYNGKITTKYWEEWAWSIKSGKKRMKPVFVLDSQLYFSCYTENLFLNSTNEPKKIHLGSRYKRRNVRSYELYLERSEEIFISRKPSLSMSINSPFVPVNPFEQGNVLQRGYNYKIYVRLGKVELESYPYDTDCIDYGKLWREKDKQGPRSQEMCKELCLHELFEQNKNITPEFEMLEYPLKVCFDWKCRTSSEDSKILESCKRNCKANCRNLKYTHTITETMRDISQIEFENYESNKDKIEVQIFYWDPQVIVEKHVPEYKTGYLFSYIGGLMGCWLGVSIWAFPGIVENVFRRALQWMIPIKRYVATVSRAQFTIFLTHRNNVRRINVS
ncbi:hypothetical protein HNY73_015522 [Argiope bruennichi]|uniref:Uncharacterized protein n=1 Tax=Argiope bruennichi TaxID=94029 RepID=A0A8T0EWT4_ARGBR|nr:hypothetical protein HNY73_015522 [Argiope bruennichi]